MTVWTVRVENALKTATLAALLDKLNTFVSCTIDVCVHSEHIAHCFCLSTAIHIDRNANERLHSTKNADPSRIDRTRNPLS